MFIYYFGDNNCSYEYEPNDVSIKKAIKKFISNDYKLDDSNADKVLSMLSDMDLMDNLYEYYKYELEGYFENYAYDEWKSTQIEEYSDSYYNNKGIM